MLVPLTMHRPRPPSFASPDSAPPPRPILAPGRSVWREVHADDSGVFVDAADYYRAFYRAARQAQHTIVMSGWQFDSAVPLLRGADVPPGAEVRFLKFLNGLCHANPGLHIYILAWDFHVVFAHEREWMQRVLFRWLTHSRLRFQFDDCPIAGGSHHQKFVVLDHALAFVGGMDICEARWDDRCHRADNPLRVSRGARAKPYHDAQAYLLGPEPARALETLFIERWTRAAGRPPEGVGLGRHAELRLDTGGALPLGATAVALSRTDPRAGAPTVREVEHVFVDAIDVADRLLYVETQYFSSRRIHRALLARMRDAGRSSLEIIVIVNERAEALKEELAVGLRQAEILADLRRVAAETGHRLGIYHALSDGASEAFPTTYIHSKLMIVDDRFLTVGSANLTNRSMAVDSELHVSWEAVATGWRLRRAIRRVRVSLLAEHSGLAGRAIRDLVRPEALVARLDAIATRPAARLRPLGPPTPAQAAVLEVIDPQALPFDSEVPEDRGAFRRDEPDDDRRPPRPSLVRRILAAAGRRRTRSG